MPFIIFDLDGTLVNTIGGIAYSCNTILKRHDYPIHTVDAYKKFVGYGLKATIEKALPQSERFTENIESCYSELLDFYQIHYAVDTFLYEGIEQLLDKIEDMGIHWAVNTNKANHIANSIADKLLGKWNPVKIMGTDENTPKKPNPYAAYKLMEIVQTPNHETIYIGDSEVDIQTARAAGVKIIVVTWGFRSVEELLPLRPDGIIYEPTELIAKYL